MLRRSLRLQDAGYYNEDGTAVVSYKEVLYRVFQRKKHLHRRQDVFSMGDSMEQNQDTTETQPSDIWIPSDSTRRTPVTGPQRRGNTTKYVEGLMLLVLMVFVLSRIREHLKEVHEESKFLRERMNRFVPVVDTIPNFALESLGAKVLQELSSDTYCPHKCTTGLLWDRIFYWHYSSTTQGRVIQGHSAFLPGQCWCFSGEQGHLFISLSHPISITHVTLGHITKSQSPAGNIASAPKQFSVYGMKTTDEEGTYLGTLDYDQDGAAFQTFEVPKPNLQVFRYMKLQIENNWGNIDYTCVYSFRVHGKLPI